MWATEEPSIEHVPTHFSLCLFILFFGNQRISRGSFETHHHYSNCIDRGRGRGIGSEAPSHPEALDARICSDRISFSARTLAQTVH